MVIWYHIAVVRLDGHRWFPVDFPMAANPLSQSNSREKMDSSLNEQQQAQYFENNPLERLKHIWCFLDCPNMVAIHWNMVAIPQKIMAEHHSHMEENPEKMGGIPESSKKRHPLNESFSYWDSFPACILSPCLFPCDFWLSLCPTIIQSSLGWFQGKSAGHPHYFKGKKPWFPVDFPFNPSSDPNFSVLLQTLNLDTKHVYLVACGKSHAWHQLIITIFTI